MRGARFGSAESCPLEKVTSVFTKRRYRDAWNRALMRKIVSMAVPLTILLQLLEESLEITPQLQAHVWRVGGLGKDAQPFGEGAGNVSPQRSAWIVLVSTLFRVGRLTHVEFSPLPLLLLIVPYSREKHPAECTVDRCICV